MSDEDNTKPLVGRDDFDDNNNLDQEDLNSDDASPIAGLGDDAMGYSDEGEDTLVPDDAKDNPLDTSSGMAEDELDSSTEGKTQLGDIVAEDNEEGVVPVP